MATIQDITQLSYYRGDPALAAGGGAVPVVFDMQPWQKLADYTYLQGKQLYDEKLKRFDEASKEAAASMKVDWSKIPEKWRGQILDEVKSLSEFLRNNPNAASRLDAGDDAFFEFQERKNNLTNLVNAGTEQGIRLAAIESQLAEKAPNKTTYDRARQKIYDGLPDDIYTPVNPFPEYGFKPIDLSTVAANLSKSFDTGNFINKQDYVGFDFSKAPFLISQMDLTNDFAPNYNLIESVKQTAEQFNSLMIGEGGYLLEKDSTGKPKNVILSEDGQFIGFSQNAMSDPQFGGMLVSIDAYNKSLEKFRATGGVGGFAINPLDGLSDSEIKAILLFGAAENKMASDLQYHGDKSKREIAAADRASRERMANADRQLQRELNITKTGAYYDFFSKIKDGSINDIGFNTVELTELFNQFNSRFPIPYGAKMRADSWAEGAKIQLLGNGFNVTVRPITATGRGPEQTFFIDKASWNTMINTKMYDIDAKGAQSSMLGAGGQTTNLGGGSSTAAGLRKQLIAEGIIPSN